MDYRNVVRRINLRLSKKDWCVYKGKCPMNMNITNDLCKHCTYKKPLDIPDLIETTL